MNRPTPVTKALAATAGYLVLALLPAMAFAQPDASWQPPPPPDDGSTWIQLASGEWLTGDVVAVHRDSLEFDSSKLGTLAIDFADLDKFRSAAPMQVAFDDGVIASGTLSIEGDAVSVDGEQDYRYERSRVLSITPGRAGERPDWFGKVTSGLNLRSGNSDQADFTARFNATRRTPKSRMDTDYIGNISEADEIEIADNHRASAAWSRTISRRFYWVPVYGEYFRDRFQNINHRGTLGTGLGYQLAKSAKVDWRVDWGLAHQRIEFVDVLEGEARSEETPVFAFGTNYTNALSNWLDFFFDFGGQIVDEDSGTYTHHLLTGLEFDVIGGIDFEISLVWDRIEDPEPNADGTIPRQDDYRLVFGLGYSF